MTEAYKKLITTLEEIFQLDQADLDFGIYRIMNQKRAEINDFLEKRLLKQVEETLANTGAMDGAAIAKELDETIKQARAIGVADPEELPKVKELRAQYFAAGSPEAMTNEVFSHLTSFFRRYYNQGDFISQRRYKKDVYAIPYEGEEVKLHWANQDQYYVKTSENFRNYTFKIEGGNTVHFRLRDVETEQNNNKAQQGKERRFRLSEDETITDEGDELNIWFTYEASDKKEKQDDFNTKALEKIKPLLPETFKNGLLKPMPTQSNPQRTLLEKHLKDYTSRNTFDYFIHKDLGGFLNREIDFYIKNEILNIDDINLDSPQSFDRQLRVVKALKTVARKIIALLAQLEDFQKKLWLKKKMVVQCDYCITLDRIPEIFYADIAANKEQHDEWVRLFAIDEIEGDLVTPAYSNPLTIEFLKANPFLVLDTKFFALEWKYKLLATIDNMDEQCDGLLINSENFQALSLLKARYNSQVACVYNDPPYNTGSDGFVYKDGYQHSSWISLMSDRTLAAKTLLRYDSGCFVSNIDKRELYNFKQLLDTIFGAESFINAIVNVNNPKGRSDQKHLPTAHDSILFYSGPNFLSYGWSPTNKVIKRYNKLDENGFKYREIDLRKTGDNDKRSDREYLFYYFYFNEHTNDLFPARDELLLEGYRKIAPMKDENTEGNWRWELETSKRNIKRLFVRYMPVKKQWSVFEMDYYLDDERVSPTSVWDEKPFNSERGTESFIGIGFAKEDFPRPKPIGLMTALFEHLTSSDDLILDHFLGSGTTICGIIELNICSDIKRKYIGCEMGEYFESIAKPRILKTIYSQTWDIGKPLNRKGSSHCFKYMKLESYEDTLNNLQLKRTGQQHALLGQEHFGEEYLLHYMLDIESRDSLLNLEMFKKPFGYTLKITENNELKAQEVDLVETFNYLIGLVVESMQIIRYNVVVQGRNLQGEKILVIWRDVEKTDNAALNEFFRKLNINTRDTEFRRICVNGDNNLENIREEDEQWKVVLIEEEFHKRMFDTKDV